ncbi:MAG: tetratricopeptide repeat protein [Oligoflexus sp.]|jgi:predicted Zn-dependent protease
MSLERFLILDDNTGNTLFFEMVLKDLGISKIFTSPTGDDALIQADKHHIQFFIVAWELKGMPGTIFIQKARSKRKRRFVPCIIYSKRMSGEDVTLTKDLGFKDILGMPFDRQVVKEMITSIIEYESHLHPKEIQLRKIEMYYLEGQPMEAFKLFNDDLFTPGPYQTRALLAAAEVMMSLSKYDKAEKCLTDALRNAPDHNRALQLKAKLLSRKGLHEEAITILEKLVTNSPKNLSNKINLGSAYIEADRHDDAKRVFKDVMDEDPDNQECKDQMATVAFKEGNFTLAEQLIAETENGNELARAFNNLAISQVAKGQFDQGIVTYSNAMKMLADKARLYLLQYNLGLAYRKKGALDKSLRELSRSYVAEPNFEKAYVAIARVVQELKAQGIRPEPDLIKQIKLIRSSHKKSA